MTLTRAVVPALRTARAPAEALADEAVVKSEFKKVPNDCSADGRFIIYQELNPKAAYDLWVFSVAAHRSFPLLQTEFDERQGHFSPDGRWIAYSSDESGTW